MYIVFHLYCHFQHDMRLQLTRLNVHKQSLVSITAALLLSVGESDGLLKKRVSLVSWQHQKFNKPQVCLVLQLLSMYFI